jgi:hypothetical protein
MAGLFAFGAFFIWFSWNRWNANLTKSAGSLNRNAGTVSLDSDGIRSMFANGASSFVPWSSFSGWKEGESVFLLTGDSSALLPIDDGNREAIRSMLTSKIS